MATTTAPTEVEFQPLTTTREQRGRQIAERGGIRQVGACYAVPAQSANSNVPAYLVDVIEQTCTCPDHAERGALGVRCKHQEAVWFWLAWEGAVSAETGKVVLPEKWVRSPEKRKTYAQNWPAYRAAQSTERVRVPQLLYALCQTVDEPEREPCAPGRKPIPRPEAIYANAIKVYSQCSGERATKDIEDAVGLGHLSRAWDANTLFREMANPELTPVLVGLIEEAVSPLVEVENVAGRFAVDSTGIGTVLFDRFFEFKHGNARLVRGPRPFIKLHLCAGVLTHIVTAVKVSKEADCPVLPELVATTAKRFAMKEVSADKAYLAKYNLAAIDKAGAVPFIPFKTNSVGMKSKSPLWRKMWAHATLRPEDWHRHYNARQNVESVMAMIKSLSGGRVRSKLPDAQVNETLMMVLLHDLKCIVHAIEKFGIEVDGFGAKSETTTPNLQLVKP